MSRTAPAAARVARRGRGARAAGTVLAAVLAAAVAEPAAAAAVPASQPLVVVLADHVARTQPGVQARRLEVVPALRPLTRVRTVLPELDRADGPGGLPWIRVRLPGRPNGHTGWIPAARTQATSTPWQLTVDVSARRVTAYRDGRVQRRFRAIVGKPSTPTPLGTFFVEEAVALSWRAPGAPFALALSARSPVLQEFAGGPGQIALHGTGNLPEPLGSASSHGCVRLSPAAITWLAGRIGRGAPLTVTR